jgi:DNA-binding PadR family transcriptional regulator
MTSEEGARMAVRRGAGKTQVTSLGRYDNPGVLILTSLVSGPKHGYALTKDIESFSGVRLTPGTLYGALDRLEERGLIEALPAEHRRLPYQLSSNGLVALRAYHDCLSSLTSALGTRLRGLGA